ncbi:hypothetical protein MVEN_01359000 [Mycena venus]|uniref:Uncharacterized protein n=1 Tax=Mycena venus TaxID=2733690 RepID=A0A8H7CW99_9AGAR|nr:hypothetical protein MVEN_01359000 [Mycena venus]
MQNNSQDHSLQWTHYNSHAQPDIKVESSSEPFSLLSPPSSPSLPFTSSSSLSCRRRSSGSINSPKRVRPYPPLPRDTRSRIDDFEMATAPAFWASSSNNSSRGGSSRANNTNNNDRRASEGNQQQLMYSSPYVSMPMYHRPSDGSDEHRLSPSSGSSGTSSLTGAMGDTHVSSRHSGSPPSSRDPLFNMMGQPLGWPQSQTPMLASQSAYPGGMTAPAYLDPQVSGTAYYRDSPESLSPPSPFTTPTFNDPFRPNPAANYASTQQTPAYAPVNPEVEIRRLRKKLRETEQLYERAREQVKALESRPAPHRAHSAGSLPSPLSTPPSTSAFQASWKARTDARIRQFCALNRAGNALCAWHDSRRERRVHPPRMAPSGYLNCGCTYEEALFEESLARHHVGSYLPGETVRMDPALRNPLLKLLQQRYGYKDGDFERDPRTGDWIPW